MATHDIRVTINGETHEGTVDSRLLLVHWLRDLPDDPHSGRSARFPQRT